MTMEQMKNMFQMSQNSIKVCLQYFQKVMSQKLNFYNAKYTGMRHLGATLIFKTLYLVQHSLLLEI